MKTAICPGSFDPVTLGHLDIIKRAARLFDRVVVLVVINTAKTPSFTAEERAEMLRTVTKDMPNVRVDVYDGLLVNYVKQHENSVIVKGLRAMTDFEYEFQMALMNRQMLDSADTLFLTTSAEFLYLSSSAVKQIASFGGDFSRFVPAEIHDKICDRLCKK
ncbi:MAG: pantetheine-phosphate adenylyltransferase [Ruminococcaceae bacterium]|nr:pantetheine-phosphate adenylyltransferase [Oscillospiraceae bacterium]